MALSDRVAIMAEGCVLQIDKPAGLYERPKTRKVASFVGSMNFLTGQVMAEDGEMTRIRITDTAQCRVPSERLAGYNGTPCLAIRPERIALPPKRPEGRALAGVLRDRVYMGERVHYHVGLEGAEDVIVVSVPNTAAQDGPRDPGAQVWLSWDDTALIPMRED